MIYCAIVGRNADSRAAFSSIQMPIPRARPHRTFPSNPPKRDVPARRDEARRKPVPRVNVPSMDGLAALSALAGTPAGTRSQI